MRKRKALRLSVDIGMTVLLFVLMAYQLTGQFAHEWAGAVMLVLFAAHHLLNRQWFLSLGKGKYAPLRVIQTAADALLLADMLALMVSGIIMSHYVFAFLPPFGRVSTARLLHLAASHWGFVLMGVHLGLHWGGMVGMVRGRLGWKPSRLRQVMLWIATAAASAYGVYAFVANQFDQYLFLQVEFAFFDFARPAYWFFLEHLAILWLFAGLTYVKHSVSLHQYPLRQQQGIPRTGAALPKTVRQKNTRVNSISIRTGKDNLMQELEHSKGSGTQTAQFHL